MGNKYYVVQYEDKDELINYLGSEGFKVIGGDYGCPWVFIDINEKIYRPGRPGVCFGSVIGNRRISYNEFVKKYEKKKTVI